MYSVRYGYSTLVLLGTFQCAQCQESSMPKIAATVIVVCGCLLIAIIISLVARRFCRCENKEQGGIDHTEISDNTRKLVQARLAIVQLQRRRELQKNTLKFFKLWRRNSSTPRNRVKKSNSSSSDKSVVIDVEEANTIEESEKKNTISNGTKSTFIKGNRVGNGSTTRPMPSPRRSVSSPKPLLSLFSPRKDPMSKNSSPASSIKSYASSYVSTSTESKTDVTSAPASPSSTSPKSSPGKAGSSATSTVSSSATSKVSSPKSATTNKKAKNVTFNEKVEIKDE